MSRRPEYTASVQRMSEVERLSYNSTQVERQ